MKSLKDYSMNLTEAEYHAYPAWSYSKIARYARDGFASLNSLDTPIKPSPEMRFGSMFDTMVTRGRKAFENEYVVTDISVPTPAKKAVIDAILARTNVPFPEIPDETYREAFEECKYQNNWGFEKKIDSLGDCIEYYSIKASGKEMVSTEEFNEAKEMVHAIRDDKYLSTIFGTKNSDDIEYLYQLQLLTNLDVKGNTYPVKCMFDLLIVNHADKTLQPVDLKTSYMPGYDFADHFVKMRYDLEAQVYVAVLKKVIEDTKYSDYTILPYLFTDISRTDKVPVTYSYDVTANPEFSFKDYTYKNWETLLSEIVTYQNSNATVPSYIKTDGPNDLLELLNHK